MSSNQRGRVQKVSMMLFDITIIHLGMLGAYFLADKPVFSGYWSAAPALLVTLLGTFYLFNVYDTWKRKSFEHLFMTIVLALGFYYTLLVAIQFLFPTSLFEAKVMMIAYFIHNTAIIAGRFVYWSSLKKAHGAKRLLIISESEEEAVALADKIIAHDQGWFEITGYRSLLLANDLAEVDVVLVSPALPIKQKQDVVAMCNSHEKELLIVPELFEIMMLDSSLEQLDDMLIFSVLPARLQKAQLLLKRAFDLAVSSVIFIAAAPVMAALFLLIPLTSEGPALYAQERMGQNKRLFQVYKFRSMVQNAESQTGPVLASESDPRITKIGRFIRATRLDELPQLWNVLKGDMSLIGPRPERPFFTEQFEAQDPAYVNRLAVKPGLTGLAQVMANYTTTVEDKLRYDLLYIRHYSFVLDLKILMQTIRVILQRKQATGVKPGKTKLQQQIQEQVSANKAAGQ